MLPGPALVSALVALLLATTGCQGSEDPPARGPRAAASEAASAAASAGAVRFPTYVALGDSYTAAPGVPRTDLATGCARSDGNYPALLAAALDSELVDVSCSGATTSDLTQSQRTGDAAVAPQLDALSPGTSLVTLGIGGNDEQFFQTLVGTCLQIAFLHPQGVPCRQQMTTGSGDTLAAKIEVIGRRVVAALAAVHERAPAATVALVGYPQPVPARGTCSTLPLAPGDDRYVRGLSVRLNDALRAAAEQGGALFVDVLKASRGHDICAGARAWVNGSQTDLSRAVAFHPFAEEQQAVARLLRRALAS